MYLVHCVVVGGHDILILYGGLWRLVGYKGVSRTLRADGGRGVCAVVMSLGGGPHGPAGFEGMLLALAVPQVNIPDLCT